MFKARYSEIIDKMVNYYYDNPKQAIMVSSLTTDENDKIIVREILLMLKGTYAENAKSFRLNYSEILHLQNILNKKNNHIFSTMTIFMTYLSIIVAMLFAYFSAMKLILFFLLIGLILVIMYLLKESAKKIK